MTTGKMIVGTGCLILLTDLVAQFYRAFTSDASFGSMVACGMIFGGCIYSTIME